jgi:hypothetical protein
VGDEERAHVGPDERVYAAGDDPKGVDVEPGVGLVENRDLRLQHRELEHLDALALAAREAVVHVAGRELAGHLQPLHRLGELRTELGDRDRVVFTAGARLADRVHGAAQEARDGDARDRVRVLEGKEETALRALVGAELP